MALILKDRVKESSSSSGTGSITLGGAFPGYQTFNAAIATGSTVYYTIHNLTAGSDTEWEVGVGTFTSPSTLARNTVLSSSNSGSLVPFTSGVSGLEVFVTQPAEQALYTNQATGIVESSGNGANTIAFTNINASNVVMVSGTISTNAANATDITNKTYVDGLFSQGVSYHEAVLVESPSTAGSLNVVYVQPNGAGNGVGATLTNNGANVALVVDGVTVSNTARVLIYSQSNAVQNGVYTVTNPGAPDPGGAKWVLTRATDADTFGLANPNTLGAGDAFFVQSGNTGAGETYVCNTQGTITFGSSNITFAQISSAQIYAAGTGLNLSNLTFSIANTAVTAAQYGNDGAVGQFTVNAQGQITNAANVSINASSISVGTLANARTTADSANGASTIVARDTNGSFAANVVTATTVNATTGNFTNITANASGLTDINASNISSGTISNARTTGSTSNSASTIVLRDANGAFEAGNVTASNFIGGGTTITSINASNISSGTIANARTTAASANGASTIVSRDSNGDFAANTVSASFSGNGVAITAINASNISTGTINNARTTASSSNGASTIVSRDVNGSFDANVVNATNISGNGASITSINASNISSGTIGSAYVSGAYANITGVGTVTSGTWQGNVIATTYGGTNLSSFTANGVVYASSTTALATGSGFVFDGTNVGIGTTSIDSWTRLKVQGTAGAQTGASQQLLVFAPTTTAGQGAGIRFNAASGAKEAVAVIGVVNEASGNLGALTFHTYGGGGDIPERMRIDSSGNVGIGANITASAVSAPSLTVGTGSGSPAITLYSSTTTQSQISFADATSGTGAYDGYMLYDQNSRFMAFGTAATERMRIHSSGGVSIGNTTDPGATNLSVTGTISGNGAPLTGINASNISSGTVGTARLATGTANSSTYLRGDQTWATVTSGITLTDDTSTNATRYPLLTASTSGTISTANVSSSKLTFNPSTGTLSATVMTASSDARFKDDVILIPNALEKTCQIRGVTYIRNDIEVKTRHAGVIAQEVEKVLPEVIGTDADGYKVVAYGNMIGLLVEAIKELKAEVDALKGK
jgi:trimeric autotransporter adhesin